MTAKQTASTIHGDVSYETVVCDSCEMEVPKETSKRFLIGDGFSKRGSTRAKDYRFEDYRFEYESVKKGWACNHCSGASVVGVPSWTAISDAYLWLTAFASVAFVSGVAVGVLL